MPVYLKDVAAIAGVSVTTVSYVLNDKGSISERTRERVREAIARTGYKRRGQAGGNLALVNTVTPPFAPSLYQAVAEYGFALHSVQWDDSLDDPPEFRARRQIAGVLVYGGTWKRSFLEGLARRHPTVLLGSLLPTVRSDAVWVDSAGGIYKAVDYLVSMGHRTIGLLNGPPHSATSAEKQVGFEQALRHTGLATGRIVAAAGFRVSDGRAAAERLLSEAPVPTAVIAGEVAFGTAVREMCADRSWRIPDDLSVVVFRDTPSFSAGQPPLSALPLPEMNIAREAVARLVRRIQDPHVAGQRVLVQPELVDRGSVKSLAEAA